MCKIPRPFSTSIRYSLKVSNAIEECPGNSFADKFEYAVLNYVEQKANYEMQLKNLETDIAIKRKQLEKLNETVNKYSDISRQLEMLSKKIGEL